MTLLRGKMNGEIVWYLKLRKRLPRNQLSTWLAGWLFVNCTRSRDVAFVDTTNTMRQMTKLHLISTVSLGYTKVFLRYTTKFTLPEIHYSLWTLQPHEVSSRSILGAGVIMSSDYPKDEIY